MSSLFPGAFFPAGYDQLASLTGVTTFDSASITVPKGTLYALIQAEGKDVRWTDDGSDPAAGVGMILSATAPEPTGFLAVQLPRLRFIQSAATGKLNVSFYTAPPR